MRCTRGCIFYLYRFKETYEKFDPQIFLLNLLLFHYRIYERTRYQNFAEIISTTKVTEQPISEIIKTYAVQYERAY